MIVSHEHGVIFVKTRKTAGTSIEIALSTLAGPRDVITRISDEDEELRRRLGGRGPQNETIPWWRLRPRDLPVVAWRRQLPRLYNHAPAREIRQAVGRRAWSGYRTFTVERNPWDRAVSLYYYLHGHSGDDRPEFSRFLQESDPSDLSNFHLYAIDGGIAVDRVIRYEDLHAGLADVWRWAALPGDVELPYAKAQRRPSETRDYRPMFSEDDAELIARVCRQEIEAHGYTFD